MGQPRGNCIIATILLFVTATQLLSASFLFQTPHEKESIVDAHGHTKEASAHHVRHGKADDQSLEGVHHGHSHKHPDHTEPEEDWILPKMYVQWHRYTQDRCMGELHRFQECMANKFC